MRLNGFVELTGRLDTDTLRTLAVGAYRMSRERPVALALNGLQHRVVDRILDPAVRADGCGASGVWYLQAITIEETLILAAERASFVIATSRELSAALDARGIRHMREDEGMVHMMDSIATPPFLPSLRGGVTTL